MKNLKILFLTGLAFIITACHNRDKAISGVYVMSFSNEYSIATDTIVIQAYSLTSGSYTIERRDGYHRIRQGKILPKEFRREHWMAIYDQEKQLLLEIADGRQIYLKGDGKTLSYGGTYTKIN
jgi:hypothetical protein